MVHSRSDELNLPRVEPVSRQHIASIWSTFLYVALVLAVSIYDAKNKNKLFTNTYQDFFDYLFKFTQLLSDSLGKSNFVVHKMHYFLYIFDADCCG